MSLAVTVADGSRRQLEADSYANSTDRRPGSSDSVGLRCSRITTHSAGRVLHRSYRYIDVPTRKSGALAVGCPLELRSNSSATRRKVNVLVQTADHRPVGQHRIAQIRRIRLKGNRHLLPPLLDGIVRANPARNIGSDVVGHQEVGRHADSQRGGDVGSQRTSQLALK